MKDEFKENVIINLTFEFALKIIDFCDDLDGLRKFALSNQLFKSGTSIGANAREAQNAESKADFIHKFKISAKEVDETEYWLLLCKHSRKLPDSTHLLTELEPIKKIISKIIGTSKRTN
jgi:four helix bundle protein